MKFMLAVVVAVAVLMPVGADAQRAGQTPTVPLTTQVPNTGRDTYDFYCAGCHGARGKGDGRVAASLRTRVPDLTTLASRNGGAFPRPRVRAAIVNTERPVTAHTTGDMPVWGTIFDIVGRSKAEAEVRIDNVVAYLETLQDPPAVSRDAGRQLFSVHCANCHGPNARGSIAAGNRRAVPDLTTFAVRNGGMFPSQLVRRIIDGREVASHVMREMPVWGDVFRSLPGGWSAVTVAARIDALTAYLESIQQRNGE